MSKEQQLDAMQIVNAVTQENLHAVLSGIESKFGLGMLVMGRDDAAQVWHEDHLTGDEPDAPEITDREWAAVTDTYPWGKGWSNDALMEDAWAVVRLAVEEAKETLAAEDATSVGWVLERYVDASVEWFNTDAGWVDELHDAATVFTNEERYDADGKWVQVWRHEVDGVLTTEACVGKAYCRDCLDVVKQLGHSA